MVYALHSRLTFSGLLGTVAAPFEEWSFRLNFSPITIGDVTEAETAAAASAWSSTIASQSGGATRLREVKFARIGPDGLYTDDPVISEVDAGGTATGSLLYPPQVALAVSLDTDRRGPTGRGRIYVPNPTINVGATGRITAANATAAVTAAANFLNALNGIQNLGSVCIASSKGYNSLVTSVRVGDVLDTIRSRRNQISEVYSASVTVDPNA